MFLLSLFWRCFVISIKECLINDEIKAKEVRLIDVDGNQLGVVSIKEALATYPVGLFGVAI